MRLALLPLVPLALGPAACSSAPALDLPRVHTPLVLPASADGETSSLAEVLDRFAAGNELLVVTDEETRSALERAAPGVLAGGPAEGSWTLLETLLATGGFTLAVQAGDGKPALQVFGPRATPSGWRAVPAERAHELREHPALLVETTVPMRNVDVRQLTTIWRGLLHDQRTESALPAGDHALVLRGTGTSIAGQVALLGAIDRANEAGAAPRALPPAPEEASGLPLPTLAAGLSLPAAGKGERSLADVLDALRAQGGIHVVTGDGTRQALAATESGIDEAVELPREKVYPFVESLLAGNGYWLEALPGLSMVRVGGGFDRQPPTCFARVAPVALPQVAGHSALLVETTFTLPHVDVRQLSTVWRGLLTDITTQTILPVGTHGMLLRGRGSDVFAWFRAMQEIDAGASPSEAIAPLKEAAAGKGSH